MEGNESWIEMKEKGERGRKEGELGEKENGIK